MYVTSISFFFFFQAEDGIRDIGVTGVQTCALPISRRWSAGETGGVPPSRGPGRAGSWCSSLGCWSSPSWRARDRKSGVEGKSVDLGGRRIIKKKTKYLTCNLDTHSLLSEQHLAYVQ